MSIIGSNILAGASGQVVGGGSYAISRSLRFNSADSAYLSRTPASAGNRKTWTWAGWVKRSALESKTVFCQAADQENRFWFRFRFDSIAIVSETSNVELLSLETTAVYRDASAWYHLVLSIDTTQDTASNRAKLYVNGSQVNVFSTEIYCAQNTDTEINTTDAFYLGAIIWGSTVKFDGYLADVHFIDGQALDPTSFGEFDTNGIWQPKAYTGTYGTNGFHLDFADNSTAAALGTDTSGQGNTWTVNNISVAAGADNDSLVDVPTNGAETDTGAGGEVRGNYCTLNPLLAGQSSPVILNGNLDWTLSQGVIVGTIGVSSDKWYWEVTASTDNLSVGIAKNNVGTASFLGADANGWSYYIDGTKYNNDTSSGYGASYTTGDVIGIAFDADNGTITFYKNGVSQDQAFSGLTSGPYFPAVGNGDSGGSCNFGQRPFAYTAPSGFKALNTASLPAPLVTKPSDLFDVKLYTGNGSTQTISGLGFDPDLIYIKNRTQSGRSPNMTDTVRGATKLLLTDDTDAETTDVNDVSAFTTGGFSVGSNPRVNGSTDAMVAWCWDAGSSTVTNTDGSISSQVRANASAGFSVVAYTGTGANATVGHGLGVAPKLFICKRRDSTGQWVVFTTAIDGSLDFLYLEKTDAKVDDSSLALPTATVFSLGSGANSNPSGGTMVAYCFAPVAGYSSMSSFVANANSDGPFVYLSFRPKFLLLKNTTRSGPWMLLDSSRDSYNVASNFLEANDADAEASTQPRIDFLSNGFKVRAGSGFTPNDVSGDVYVYAAWAEAPFQYARAR